MAIITGTPGDDSALLGGNNLTGTDGNDEIFGFAGNDILLGNEGDDFLLGGGGNDILTGDAGNDFLDGGGGNDNLFAFGGDDVLFGGNGNDLLNGSRFGSHQLFGGGGNDTYQTDGFGDSITEDTNGGIDTVEILSSGSVSGIFTLGANLENLDMLEPVSLNGTGNSLNNSIRGSLLNDIISGLAGNDFLDGEDGDDILVGGDGNDTLAGTVGNDRMFGGVGADRFRFDRLESEIDIIADFVAADDSIQVVAEFFGGGLNAGSAISAGQFRLGSSAVDASDRFIYNNNGAMFFDADGVGGAFQVQIATLIGAPTLAAADIVVI